MRHTNRQTTRRTLTDLYRVIDRRKAVTITYQDETGAETVRTIEPYDLRVTQNGHIRVHAMCRHRGEDRAFYITRIVAYTVHRGAFVLDRPEATSPARRVTVVRSAAQLIARELGRDYPPVRRITRTDTDLAA